MLANIDPTKTRAWGKLERHFEETRNNRMKEMFESNSDRFDHFSLKLDDILVDFSKNRIDNKTLKLLTELAEESGVQNAIELMFTGDKINVTENRAVLHTALRNRSAKPVFVEGEDVMINVHRVLDQVKQFTLDLHFGTWKGYSAKKITDIVNIGIGGSDLGPVMVCESLKPYWVEGISEK